jgi:hypothetical protein
MAAPKSLTHTNPPPPQKKERKTTTYHSYGKKKQYIHEYVDNVF